MMKNPQETAPVDVLVECPTCKAPTTRTEKVGAYDTCHEHMYVGRISDAAISDLAQWATLAAEDMEREGLSEYITTHLRDAIENIRTLTGNAALARVEGAK